MTLPSAAAEHYKRSAAGPLPNEDLQGANVTLLNQPFEVPWC